MTLFCDHFITHTELGSDDPWVGSKCKLPSGHAGGHSALYADERGREPGRYEALAAAATRVVEAEFTTERLAATRALASLLSDTSIDRSDDDE